MIVTSGLYEKSQYLFVCQLCNNMDIIELSKQSFYPFIVHKYHIGFIHPMFMQFLEEHFAKDRNYFKELEKNDIEVQFPRISRYFDKGIILSQEAGSSSEQITKFFDDLFRRIKKWVDQNSSGSKIDTAKYLILTPLMGWREEKYGVYADPLLPGFSPYGSPLLFQIERSAVSLLGVTGYGVHANGIVVDPSKSNNASITTNNIGNINEKSYDIQRAIDNFVNLQDERRHSWKMWIARRSLSKFTFPGQLDQLTAGGLSVPQTPHSTLAKECWEEAGLNPDYTLDHAISVGTISYCRTSHFGIAPKIQFIYDLFLPEDFVPKPIDGEVGEFYLWTINEVLDRVKKGEFKPNCALTILDFCIRHGILRSDNEPAYNHILEATHSSLPFFTCQ